MCPLRNYLNAISRWLRYAARIYAERQHLRELDETSVKDIGQDRVTCELRRPLRQ